MPCSSTIRVALLLTPFVAMSVCVQVKGAAEDEHQTTLATALASAAASNREALAALRAQHGVQRMEDATRRKVERREDATRHEAELAAAVDAAVEAQRLAQEHRHEAARFDLARQVA